MSTFSAKPADVVQEGFGMDATNKVQEKKERKKKLS